MYVNGKLLELEPHAWYNLDTKRINTMIRDLDVYIVPSTRVFGSKDSVLKCMKENGITTEPEYAKKSTHLLRYLCMNVVCKSHGMDLVGYFGKAQIVDIHDGDTLTVDMKVSLNDLNCERYHGIYTYMWARKMCKFTTRLVCRTYGYDAVELSTPDGKTARDLLAKKLGKSVYLHIVGIDKYGRNLVVMYSDKYRCTQLNTYLLSMGEKYASVYLGGTK